MRLAAKALPLMLARRFGHSTLEPLNDSLDHDGMLTVRDEAAQVFVPPSPRRGGAPAAP